jgi:hypothetical protein
VVGRLAARARRRRILRFGGVRRMLLEPADLLHVSESTEKVWSQKAPRDVLFITPNHSLPELVRWRSNPTRGL